nr:MAG TPA: Portal protein [Caudoviricetes sp.]
MAKKDDKKKSSNGIINRLSNTIQNNLDNLYSKTYYSQPSNKQDLESIKSKLDSSIDNIVSVNMDNTGKGTMSTLYSRMQQQGSTLKPGDKESGKSLESLINDSQVIEAGLMGFINNTTTVFDYDNKIDTILKYMPRLQEALDTRKDNVLSADHFSKDYINITSSNITNDSETYNEHIKFIKETYKFQDLTDEIYEQASKYGEAFVYVVPYKKAVARLLKQKNNTRAELDIKESTIITELGNIQMDELPKDITPEMFKEAGLDNIELECYTGAINSVVENTMRFEKACQSLNEMSLNYEGVNFSEETILESAENIRDVVKGRFQKTIKDDLSFEGFDDRGQDGLVDKNTAKRKTKDDKFINVPGTIVKVLERKHVIPIYIEEYCFGYYYIEVDGPYNPVGDYDKMQDPTMSLKGSNSILSTNSMLDQSNKQNTIIRFLANQISNFIDAKFINANQDLRNEIYTVLKYNYDNNSSHMNKVRVTFIPPDDMEHVYFNMNKDTHRGISDLDKAMFPATLYCAMYITHSIWNMTRAQDKRVYYVNQTVDTNISKTLLNTINQIKKGNFGIRQIENINHILNITGMFNDYIIPRSPGGQAPIDFEVMQGQQVEWQTEFMTSLEEMAVNSTDVPMEMIQMRNSVDYSSQLTMSSSKFLRKVYNRQSKYQKNLTHIFNKIYNNEFDDNIQLSVVLPPPMFLNITNTNQMMTNVNEYSQSVAQLILDPDEQEPIKNEVIREINKYNLGSYLNIQELEDIAHKAKQHVAAATNDDNQEQ